jgi:phosphoglycolate phosphatase-like HAD superfamily hydrolase
MKTDVVLVFDGDDTLWMNEWQYSRARAVFFAFLYEEFGDLMPSLVRVFPHYFEIDHGLFPIWGIERGRVFTAMIKTYQELLEHFRKKLGEENERYKAIVGKKEEHEKRIFEIGDMPFDFYDMKWVDGAEDVLAELKRDDRFTLCLLTSYDAKVWRDRSKYLGVDRFFEYVKVVSGRKTKLDFIEASDYYRAMHRARFCAIGNGESDIRPALEISPLWRGIYIPHASSSPVFQNKKGADIYMPPPIEDDRVLTLRSIRDLSSVDFESFLS